MCDVGAVIITGVYGSGKSSVAAEIAHLLEKRGDPYAYLDLDFLSWGYSGRDVGAEHRMLLRNLAPVASNYLDAGVRFFVLAGFVGDRGKLETLRAELRMPLRVVRLALPLDEIEKRLCSDVTTGRRDDLREAAIQIAGSEGVGIEDLAVPNDRPVRQVATEIMAWLGWE
jgi:adenylylsulfate kinase-like enzyme